MHASNKYAMWSSAEAVLTARAGKKTMNANRFQLQNHKRNEKNWATKVEHRFWWWLVTMNLWASGIRIVSIRVIRSPRRLPSFVASCVCVCVFAYSISFVNSLRRTCITLEYLHKDTHALAPPPPLSEAHFSLRIASHWTACIYALSVATRFDF